MADTTKNGFHSLLTVEDVSIQVTRKNIKNMYLRVYPGSGIVKLSGPRHIRQSTLEEFVVSRIPWIKKQLKRKPATPFKEKNSFVTGEIHRVWGKKRKLLVIEGRQNHGVTLNRFEELELHIRKGSSLKKREEVLNSWYREELKREIARLIDKWEPVMGVSVNDFGVKKMKTRWGSCNIRAKRIWLNLELAKRDPACLEMVVVHEMVHLLERLHSKRFYGYMDKFLPYWKQSDRLLREIR
jgi:predicted metal-dependent hydrolase